MSIRERWLLGISALLCLIISGYLSLTHEKLDIIPKNINVTDFNGTTRTETILIYSNEYKLSKVGSELFATIGIALLIYIFIERNLSETERKRHELIDEARKKEVDERNEFQRKEAEKREEQQKKELQQINEDITLNVFNGVLKTVIPAEIFDILNADILNKKVIRKNVEWDYEIKDAPEGYQLIQKISYECFNISHIREIYHLNVSITNNDNQQCSVDENFSFEKHDGTQIDNLLPVIQTSTQKSYQLPLEPQQVIKVQYRILYKYTGHHIVDAHYCNTSIININLTIRKPADCKFRAFGTFSSKLVLKEDDPESIKYKPIKGMLTGQALVYMLDKQQPEDNQPRLDLPST